MVRKPTDMYVFIDRMISKGFEESELLADFRKCLPFIVEAVKPNPRKVKRFINNVVLARAVIIAKRPSEQLHLDGLIAVQALTHREEWNYFLELITPDDSVLVLQTVPLKVKTQFGLSKSDWIDSCYGSSGQMN